MTSFALQLIAMTTMLTDHIGEYFMEDYLPFRAIGRFAFIIYAFLLAEGFRHYKDDEKRVSSHLGFLVVLTVISEICYDFIDRRSFSVTDLLASQSAMLTLLLAFLGLIALEKWKDRPLYASFVVILTAMLNYLVRSNYKLMGVVLVYMFYVYLYFFEGKTYLRRVCELMVIMLVYLLFYHWAYNDFCSLTAYFAKLTPFYRWLYGMHLLAPFLLAAYNGNEGYKSRPFKIFYRCFYPAHLLILGIILKLTRQ